MNRRRFLALASLGAVALARGRMPSLPATPVLAPVEALPVTTWIDTGTLDLGLVRDITAFNPDHSFQVFGETFEGTPFIGCEKLWVTSTAEAA